MKDSDTKPPVALTFSQVLTAHGFSCGSHFRYSWMQLWRRGNLQYCEVSPAPKNSGSHGEARIVGSGLGEKDFADPESLDAFLKAH